MSRRKSLSAREPNGRIQRASRDTELASPTELARLRDAVLSGLRGAEWGSPLAILHMTGRLSSAQYAAGKRWAELVVNYSRAQRSPKPPCSRDLEFTAAGSDAETHDREIKRHQKSTAAWLAGRAALRSAGLAAERAVEHVVERDGAPEGFAQLEALKAGLTALSTHWQKKR